MLRSFAVVLVPFPYSDRLAEKRRPALILGRVWVAMITSAATSFLGDARIDDLQQAGLPVPSTLRASKIATLDADRVIRVLGRLSSRDEDAARAALRTCAGF
jgi:mRNA interferase MazF